MSLSLESRFSTTREVPEMVFLAYFTPGEGVDEDPEDMRTKG